MNWITSPARARTSAWIIRTLARALNRARWGLLAADVGLADVSASLGNYKVIGHPDLAVQRLLVLQILRRCAVARTDIEEMLSDIEPSVLDEGLRALEGQDVILVEGERITATVCSRYLDDLGLISL